MLLLVAAFTPRVIFAEDFSFRGVSSFAILSPKFPCSRFLQIAERAKRPALAVLWETFGEDETCVKQFFDKFKDRPTFLEVHFTNEVCRKTPGRCADNAFVRDGTRAYNRRLEEFSPETEAVLLERLNAIFGFVARTANPDTYVTISGGLEDQFSDRAWNNLADFFYKHSPFGITRNPTSGAGKSRRYANTEYHSTDAKPTAGCIANEDGNDQSTSESRAFLRHYRKCDVVLLWRDAHQGLSVGGKKPPHKDRTFVISARDVRDLGKLLEQAP